MKKMIEMKHHVDDYECMWNGIEDMYYLSYYPKLYHCQHIPIHYIMMAGYDDEKGCAYIYDCGVAGVSEISYAVLEQAMNIEKSSLGYKNTVCKIRFREKLPTTLALARESFRRKAEFQLNPPVGFLGIRGMEKLAGVLEPLGTDYHIPEWKEAAKHFLRSGKLMEKMTAETMKYLLDVEHEEPPILGELVCQIAEQERMAYEKVLEGAVS